MRVPSTRRIALAAMALAAAWPDAPAAAQSLPAIHLSGDLRLRLEDDADSHTAAGVKRPDRRRARVRARVEADADLGEGFHAQLRLRTGPENSQQGSNITFADIDGNAVERFKVSLDRFSAGWKGRHGGVELGRMALPFFTTNEYFWDADISPLGGAATVIVPLTGDTRLRLIGGGFALPVGLAHYSGQLFAGQAVVEGKRATVAAGLFRFQADRTDPDRLLQLDDNGSRDYTVLTINTQYRRTLAGKPLALTADLYRNVQGYADDPDAISRRYADQRTGFVLGTAWGDTAAAHHVQLGYRYFRMEKLAVDASYSHDDAARLGTAAQAALTDLTGHDLYVNYALTKKLAVGARTIFSHRLTSVEDDKRVRLDLTLSL